MYKYITVSLFLFQVLFLSAQNSFYNTSSKDKVEIKFKSINNLIIIPVTLNDKSLQFILDTGVDQTILFGFSKNETDNFADFQKIKISGLGTEKPIDGIKTFRNKLKINTLTDNNHETIILIDEKINLSSTLGIEVNGIIGYSLFQNFPIEINYSTNKIIIYTNPERDFEKKKLQYEQIPISVINNKPYITTNLVLTNFTSIHSQQLLLDLGNSDAVWLFESAMTQQLLSNSKYITDYLGTGFNGEIEGKKTKINTLSLGRFLLENPICSIPDSTSLQNMVVIKNRKGSIGNEILSRFNIIFDYKNENIYLRKNKYFNRPFKYNNCGITAQHAGLQWTIEEVPFFESVNSGNQSSYKISREAQISIRFKLKPVFEILHIRKNSPAEIAGLKKGDLLKIINGRKTDHSSLQKINDLLKQNEPKKFSITVLREGKLLKFQFKSEMIL